MGGLARQSEEKDGVVCETDVARGLFPVVEGSECHVMEEILETVPAGEMKRKKSRLWKKPLNTCHRNQSLQLKYSIKAWVVWHVQFNASLGK